MTGRPLAFVTGATSGIGRATAQALAADGYDLLLLGRRADRLDALRRELSDVTVTPWVGDVTQRDAIRRDAHAHADVLARVDVLVNNAGLARGGVGPVHRSDPVHWDAMVDTNLKGLLLTTQLVVPHMVRRGRGHVVNLGSVAARQVYGGLAVYAATKAAVASFTNSLRHDVAGSGVRVTNIEPGIVRTEFSTVMNEGDTTKGDAFVAALQPLEPEDIARAIAWCLRQPPHVTVQEILLMPTDQVAPGKVVRVKAPSATRG